MPQFKKALPYLILGALVLSIYSGVSWFISTGNQFVAQDERVKTAIAQIGVTLQKRMDLIPNFVESVRAGAKSEKEILTGVIQARNQAAKIDASSVIDNPERFKQFQQAQDGLGAMLNRLMVVVEKYPSLQSQAGFQELRTKLNDLEKEISTQRSSFNTVVQEFNTSIRVFPASIIAGMRGFVARPYFEAQAGAENVPKVKFE